MLSWLGFATVGVILALLLTNRVAAVVALAGVPIVAAFVAGFGPAEVGEFAGAGIADVAGTAAMFVFAIAFFGVLRDAGMFDPIIDRIVGFAGNAPATVCLATTALACAVHLDGAGATTFLITIPAMLPVFDGLGMRRLLLATCVGLGAGVMNLLPWGGPAVRAASTTDVPVNDLWVPLIPAQIAGVVTVLVIAWWLGRRESKRLTAAEPVAVAAVGGPDRPGATPAVGGDVTTADTADATDRDESRVTVSPGAAGDDTDAGALRRPKLFWFNIALTVAVIGGLVAGVAAAEAVFLAGLVIALIVNYPGLKAQTDRIEAHAKGAMLMVTTLLAAGVFLGILEASGMIEAMATAAAEAIPAGAAPALPLIVGVLGVPLSLLFGPDAFYFGVLPVLTGVGEQFGITGTELAQAALLGQETLGFPISPLTGSFYLLVGLAGVEIGKHIRALIGWAWLASLVMLAVALATGAIPVWAS
ncbi:CitMHS family citrate-Mg2+:H+ or citrate-Ca2+:H+ symporter [Prauserella isguenensis]|uniref:CitMHS family citrate-Mg2+:H+ or citrate-Ca2+:H+ symporter n=1 Tax=Prauserella isguenensis TaxID=1470180 RepID=A0A839S268_9PSEU|nr:SLC13 family permease [Prauserella isguenensis]MBB3051414.1 CitMHS family citrate-Mg2+:H+ or citrate-Ca2+:H+ symporter [Prauserella isguenensis]